MDLPDCMEVCSFSTTSPSWIRSCLTLMPVISSNAFASVFDSYSCVVMVSDTTEISFTPLACSFLAASMNHFISAVCWSLLRVDGWNSLSIHFLASASPAQALCIANAAAASASAVYRIFMDVSSRCFPVLCRSRPRESEEPDSVKKNMCSAFAHDQRQHQHRQHEADPDRGLGLQPQPFLEL